MSLKKRKFSTIQRAHFDQKPAIIKVYRNTPYGRLRWLLAYAAASHIRRCGIPAPELLFGGWAPEWRAYVLIYRHIQGDTLRWLRRESNEAAQTSILKRVTELLALMHSNGVVQRDTNLGNFLDTGSQILALDEDRMTCLPWQAGRHRSLRNLASLLSRISPVSSTTAGALYQHYRKARGWADRPGDRDDLASLIQHLHSRRQRRKKRG